MTLLKKIFINVYVRYFNVHYAIIYKELILYMPYMPINTTLK